MSSRTSNQLPQLPDYKKAMVSFTNGFVIGAFTGIVLCLITATSYMSLPLILGLIFGVIAFEIKIKENGK